jgi:hypothetical protein
MSDTERLQQERQMWLGQLQAADDHNDCAHYKRALKELARIEAALNRLYAECES